MTSLRGRLRALPAFPRDLPVLDPALLPDDPNEQFLAWLEDAIAAGGRQPHAMTLTTVTADGTPVGRTLILKDLDERGYHFSTRRSSRKGQQLHENPGCSMVFFWRESGRQVRLTGDAVPLDDETSQADWRTRPSYDGRPEPDWQVYALQATEVEFMQAREDRRHTRIEYRRTGTGWVHGPVTTPAG